MPDNSEKKNSLEEHLISVETANADHESADLLPLTDYLGDATIVGMGEATHGTSEFFTLKHRIFRLLVQELDFRIFTMEATFSEALVINDYILYGSGDPEVAVGDISSWVWDTEEVLELIKWMRSFNQERPIEDRIRFYGLDVQYNREAARAIRRYLQSTDTTFFNRIEDDLDSLVSANIKQDPEIIDDLFEISDVLTDELTNRFEENRSAYIRQTSVKDWELARQHVWVLSQVVELCRLFQNEEYLRASNLRDRCMAENIRWVQEYEESEKVAVWGHNVHIRKNKSESKEKKELTLGKLLDERFGEDYYALGFEFGRGDFRAYPEHPGESDTEVRAITVESLSEEWPYTEIEESVDTSFDKLNEPQFNKVLTNADGNIFFVDFDEAICDATLQPWLESPHLTNSIGTIFGSSWKVRCQIVEFPKEFDGLLFVTETTAASPL